MKYGIGQYCPKMSDDLFLKPVTKGASTPLAGNRETVKVEIEKDLNYYFHGKIKKVEDREQRFKVYLYKDSLINKQIITYLEIDNLVQNNEWEEVSFTFHAEDNFDYIVFEYGSNYENPPIILYQELSIVHNIPPFKEDKKIIKIGVKSNPGTLIIINDEPIRVGRSGVYELKIDGVKIEFFGVIASPLEDYQIYIDKYYKRTLNDLLNTMKESKCIFDNPYRKRDDNFLFIIDYLYYEKDKEGDE